MKLKPLLMASLASFVLAGKAQGNEPTTAVAPNERSNAIHQTGFASISTSPEPADDDLCWESPEWRGDTSSEQLTQVPHE